MLVICITGMPGSGKEEFLKVAKEMNLSIVRMGDVVRDEARHMGLPITDEAVGGMANDERRKHGNGIWAERTAQRISAGTVIIDGVRGPAELDIFRGRFGEDLIVIAIHAAPSTRFERVMHRNRSDDVKNRGDFDMRDSRELSWGLGEVIATADIMIVNERSLDEFHKEVRALLSKLLSRGQGDVSLA